MFSRSIRMLYLTSFFRILLCDVCGRSVKDFYGNKRITYRQFFTSLYVVTGCNPNDLDIWTDWCRLGLQFVVYKSGSKNGHL